MSNNNNNIDEISLKDLAISIFSSIVKMIIKYKIILLFVCIFCLLIFIYFDYTSYLAKVPTTKYVALPEDEVNNVPDDMIIKFENLNIKKDVDKTKIKHFIKAEESPKYNGNYYIYSIYLRLDKSVSFAYFKNFSNYLQTDLISNYLLRNFNIKQIFLSSPEIPISVKQYKEEHFPVNSLQISISAITLLDDNVKKRFINYILSYIFMNEINNLIETVKQPLMVSSSSMILTQDYEQTQVRSEILLLLIQLQKGIQAIFDLRNNNLGENYRLIYNYLINISTENKFEYFKMTKDTLLEFLHREFLNVSSMDVKFYFIDIMKSTFIKKYTFDIKKILLFLLGSFFITLIILYIFDFFKKNWKEIVELSKIDKKNK